MHLAFSNTRFQSAAQSVGRLAIALHCTCSNALHEIMQDHTQTPLALQNQQPLNQLYLDALTSQGSHVPKLS